MKLLITQCTDSSKWYANKVGEYVPFIEDCGTEWKSVQDPDPEFHGKRFINFVSKKDAKLVKDDV